MEQSHRVDLKVAVQHFRVDIHEVAEGATNRVVDQDLRCSQVGLNRIDGSIELDLIGYITWIGPRICQLGFEGD